MKSRSRFSVGKSFSKGKVADQVGYLSWGFPTLEIQFRASNFSIGDTEKPIVGGNLQPETDAQSAVVNGREVDLWYLEVSINSSMYKTWV